MSLDLTYEEREALAPLEARFSERAHRPMTLQRLLSSWDNIVQEIEREYDETIDDYTNDLTTRDVIEEAMGSVPASVKPKLESILTPLDERFMQATRPDDLQLISHYMRHGPAWWWSRIPLRLGENAVSTFRVP